MTRAAQLLLTEAEAAASLRVCPRVLRKARQTGELHYVLIGRSVRYTVTDLESFVERQRKVSAPCPTPSQNGSPTRRGTARGNSKSGVIVPFHLRKSGARGGDSL